MNHVNKIFRVAVDMIMNGYKPRFAGPVFWLQLKLAVPKFSRELGRVSSFNKSIKRHHHMKDHVEIGHLTEYDAFRLNRDQVMALEIWLKIHTNICNCETASPKIR